MFGSVENETYLIPSSNCLKRGRLSLSESISHADGDRYQTAFRMEARPDPRDGKVCDGRISLLMEYTPPDISFFSSFPSWSTSQLRSPRRTLLGKKELAAVGM